MTGQKSHHPVYTIDLNFMGMANTIAAYLIPHSHGAVLVESGPGSTLETLQSALQDHGFRPADITDVLLTHIHLDHAGAAGWLARQGAHIYVHPIGAPHMLEPDKLLSSAARIYGEMMEILWGEFLAVPEDQLSVIEDGQVIEIAGLEFKAIDTPGHANHHLSYIFDNLCFTGDIGGVRLPGPAHVRLPMPPPEFNLERWQTSLKRLQSDWQAGAFTRIAPTHFGVYDDAGWYLQALEDTLEETKAWIEAEMPSDPPIEQLTERFLAWARQRSLAHGLEEQHLEAYEMANPSWMSPYGIKRYWNKHRANG